MGIWSPRNMRDHILDDLPLPAAAGLGRRRKPVDENGDPLPDNGRLTKVKCPTCGVKRHDFQIVDCSSLPIAEDWACDACWTSWMREGRNVTGHPQPPQSQAEWSRRWVVAHGAPQEIIDRHAARVGGPEERPYNGRGVRRTSM